MQNYGVSALRHRTTPLPTADQLEERGFAIKMRKFVSNYLCCRYEDAGTRSSRATKSNKMKSQKRAVLLHMAYGYALAAWLVVWLPYLVVIFSNPPDVLVILSQVMQPLQGFLNFFVYMAPKVRGTARMIALRKKSDSSIHQNQQHLSWCQIFLKAYMSRGAKNTRHLNCTERERKSCMAIIVRKMNETSRIISERVQLVVFTMSGRTSFSSPPRPAEFSTDADDCLECGRSTN